VTTFDVERDLAVLRLADATERANHIATARAILNFHGGRSAGLALRMLEKWLEDAARAEGWDHLSARDEEVP